jgi:hypothetical protein
VIPATVALDVILVQRADLAIWVADALVFASGLSFGISVRRRERSDAPPLFFGRDEPASSRPLTAGGDEVATSPAEAFRQAGVAAARSPRASSCRIGDEGLKPLKVQ